MSEIHVEQLHKEVHVYGQEVVVPAVMNYCAICSYGILWAFRVKPLCYLVAPDSYVWRSEGYECFVGFVAGDYNPIDTLVCLDSLEEKVYH